MIHRLINFLRFGHYAITIAYSGPAIDDGREDHFTLLDAAVSGGAKLLANVGESKFDIAVVPDAPGSFRYYLRPGSGKISVIGLQYKLAVNYMQA